MSRERPPEVLHLTKTLSVDWDSVRLCHAGAGSIGQCRAATRALGTDYYRKCGHDRGKPHDA